MDKDGQLSLSRPDVIEAHLKLARQYYQADSRVVRPREPAKKPVVADAEDGSHEDREGQEGEESEPTFRDPLPQSWAFFFLFLPILLPVILTRQRTSQRDRSGIGSALYAIGSLTRSHSSHISTYQQSLRCNGFV